jgi:predicted phage terminase large subunit-like protein
MIEAVLNKRERFVWISAPTRYGKSETLAIAAILLAVLYHLKVPIVAGSKAKAEKIMEYVIAHLGDHPDISDGLLNLNNMTNVDKLKVQASQQALKWKTGGWIYVTSIDSKSIQSEGEGVVGEGGDVILLEEAGLIKRKEQYSKVVRMIETDSGWGKIVMSGNCKEKSIFEDAWNDELFTKVRISLKQAIKEGRIDTTLLAQKKTQTTTKDWKRYYLVRFPKSNEFTYFKPKKYDILPPIKDLKIFAALDPALGENKKGSLIGNVILGQHVTTGQIYEVDSNGFDIGIDLVINRVLSSPYKFQRYGVEAIQFQKYLLNTIEAKSKEKELYIPFEAIQQSQSKETRIESLEPFINTGQILFKGDNELWNEMQDYPDCEKFDVLDTLEMALRLINNGGVFVSSF